MNTTYFLPMTKSFKWVTFLAMILILVGLGYMLYAWILEHDIEMLIGIIVIVLVVGGTLCMIPRSVSVTKDYIDIHLLAWKINIPADEIVKIEHYPHGIQSKPYCRSRWLLWQPGIVYLQRMWQTLVFDYRPYGRLHHHPQKQNANCSERSRQQRFQRHCRSTREKLNFFALSFA